MSGSLRLTRRAFLSHVNSTAAAALIAPTALVTPTMSVSSTRAGKSSLLELSAVDAVAAMVRGDITAERYAEALLARCAAGRWLNALISLEPEKVLEAARQCDRQRGAGQPLRALHGLPIPIKDSVNTKDYPTTAGTPALRHFRPREDAPVVRSLVDAGAIVLGKTNLHELSYGYTSNNLAFGAVHNPYGSKHIPGGSSGGTGAAIAARMAPLGLAEDTEGSIRVPAAMCGIVGFRPTTGRYSTQGAVPITPLFDQVGPHARNVSDIALFDSVVARDNAPLVAPSLKGLRLGIVRDYWYTSLDPEVERVTADALKRLRAAGVELVEARMPDVERLVSLATDPIQNHDVSVYLAQYLDRYGAGVSFEQVLAQASADIRDLFATFVPPGSRDFVTETAYKEARDRHVPALKRAYQELFAATGVTALVFPTTMIPPPIIGQESDLQLGGKRVSFYTAVARNIAPGSTAGIPGLVLPAGRTRSGLPVGIEFDGPSGSDRAVLALGLALERELEALPDPLA